MAQRAKRRGQSVSFFIAPFSQRPGSIRYALRALRFARLPRFNGFTRNTPDKQAHPLKAELQQRDIIMF